MAGVSGVRGGAAARISTAQRDEVKESQRAAQGASKQAAGASAGAAAAEPRVRADADTVRDSRRVAAADPTAAALRTSLADRVVSGVQSAAEQVKDTVRSGIDRVVGGVQSAAETVKEGVQEGVQRLDEIYGQSSGPQPVKSDVLERHRRQLEQLGPGDSRIDEGGAQATVKGVKGAMKGGREIKVNDDGTVSVTLDANAAIGLRGKLTSVGGGEATLGGGGKVEYQFANKEEAAKALEMLDRGAIETGSPVQMGGMRYESHLTDQEKEWLGKRIKSVEVRGTEAAELALELGLKSKQTGVATLGVGGKLTGSQEEALRINFENGEPKSLTHRTTMKGSGEAFAGVGLDGLQTKGGDATGAVPVVKAGREVTFDTETTYKLPDVDGGRLLSDPAGALRDAVPLEEEKSSAKITVVDKGGALGNGVERQREYEVEGKWEDIQRSGALAESVFGDRARAEELGRAHDVTVKAPKQTDFVTTGLDIEPGLDVGVYGGGFSIKSVTRDARGDGNPAIEGAAVAGVDPALGES